MTEKQAAPGTGMATLILTDGKAGDLAQCRGVAQALGAQVTENVVNPAVFARAIGRKGSDPAFDQAVEAMETVPNVVIASGRRTVPYLRSLKTRWGRKTVTVFLKDPRTGPGTADLIWVPTHDRLRGSNVIVTDTAPHGFQADVLRTAGTAFAAQMHTYPKPWLGVLLGGATKNVPYEEDTRAALVAAIKKAGETAGSVWITPSRRTPPALIDRLGQVHPSTWIWDGVGTNPYAGMLGACDALLVTGDSHNMVSEALAAGSQVIVFRPAGLRPKFGRFLDGLKSKGLIVDPSPMDANRRQAPIDATTIIADQIKALLNGRS